jgi:hypothetical protein
MEQERRRSKRGEEGGKGVKVIEGRYWKKERRKG